MSLKVTSRKIDGIVVVDMVGRITEGESRLLLRSTVHRFVDDGNNKFVLNLSGVNYVDSCGLGELAATKRLLASQNGRVCLVGLTDRVQNVLVLTKLAVEFDSFTDETKAVAALRS